MILECTKCKQMLPEEAFSRHPDGRYRNGRQWHCKTCNAEYRERHKLTHPHNAEYTRAAILKSKYALTVAEYDAMFWSQEGKCAVCLRVPKTRRLAVDHCHVTGRVRGLLCVNCNLGLGNFQDTPELLMAAHRYLADTASSRAA